MNTWSTLVPASSAAVAVLSTVCGFATVGTMVARSNRTTRS